MEMGRPLTPREAAGKVALLKVAGVGEVVALKEGWELGLARLPLEPNCPTDGPCGEVVGLDAAAARNSAAR